MNREPIPTRIITKLAENSRIELRYLKLLFLEKRKNGEKRGQYIHSLFSQQRMATLLADGGFIVEALAPLKEGIEALLHALAFLYHEDSEAPVPDAFIESTLRRDAWVTDDAAKLVANLRASINDLAEDAARDLLRQGRDLFEHVSETLNRRNHSAHP